MEAKLMSEFNAGHTGTSIKKEGYEKIRFDIIGFEYSSVWVQ